MGLRGGFSGPRLNPANPALSPASNTNLSSYRWTTANMINTSAPILSLITSLTWKTLSVIFQRNMESVYKILGKKIYFIYLVGFRWYSDQDCIFVSSDIINHQLRIKMESNKSKPIKTYIEKKIDVLRVHNIVTNITNPGGNLTWTVEGAPLNQEKNLNCVSASLCMCVCVLASNKSSFLPWNICHFSSAISGNDFFEMKQDKSIVNTPLRRSTPFPCQNFGV